MLSLVLETKPKAIWLAFGANLKAWLAKWRDMETESGRREGDRARVFISVGSVAVANEVRQWEGVDVIVAQGEIIALSLA